MNDVERINKQLETLRKSKVSPNKQNDNNQRFSNARFLEYYRQEEQKKKKQKDKSKHLNNHVKILTDGGGTHLDVIEGLRKGVFGDDYVIAKNLDQLELALTKKPFISDYIFVECILMNINNKDLERLQDLISKSRDVRVAVIIDNKLIYDKIDFCQFAFDSYNLTEKYFNRYIDKRLNNKESIDKETRYKLYRRLKGHYNLLNNIIRRVNNNEDIKKVSRTTIARKTISFLTFFSLLLSGNKLSRQMTNKQTSMFKQDTHKQFYNFMEDYHYGYKYIHKNLLIYFKELNDIYKAVLTAELTTFNLKSYCVKNHLNEYKTTVYFDLTNRLSYDRFCMMYEELLSTKVTRYNTFLMLFKIYNYDKITINR